MTDAREAVARLVASRTALRLGVNRVWESCVPITDAAGKLCGAEVGVATMHLLRSLAEAK